MIHNPKIKGGIMQILVVFKNDTREVIATFELNTIVTDMKVLVIPGVSYLISFKRDIFYITSNGKVFVKEV